ncbi:MAG: tRNA lysidine(34) synthetase TilS, partial [Bacillota bacterium]|nr:tRNA lysidine(34) synthetase TilS [Bacillota bacterium]
MRKKVRAAIEQFHMLPHGAKVVVGLSGGADSVALLHLLASLREEYRWELSALHLHHGLRGAEADGDARFAEDFAASLGIPCMVQRADVPAESRKRRLGEEECGRLLRYEALQKAAGADGWIAVAHHQKDQAETVLMRLCRGTGLTGLTAMTPVRGRICRPLLFLGREELETYCRKNHLAWREDSTNSEEKYTRNKLRHRVIPVLEEINPAAVAHIAETAALLWEEEDYLEAEAAHYYEKVLRKAQAEEVQLDRRELEGLHPAMRRRVLRKALSVFLQKDLSQVQIAVLEELLQKGTGKQRHLLGGVTAENRYDMLVLKKGEAESSAFCRELTAGERISIPEAGITVEVDIAMKREKMDANNLEMVFDYDKIKKSLFCRTRRR